jgi:phosphoserine phosphatase
MKTAFCFDMDGTITKLEVLPLLARELGIEPEMSILTQATINGFLPFDQSFRLRIRLLADIPIHKVQNIIENVPLQIQIINFIQANLENCYIVTGNLDIWIEKLIKKIGCNFYSTKAEYSGDKLIGLKTSFSKAEAIKNLRNKGYERIVAIGDGMNDVQMFEIADIKIAFGGVHQPVLSLIKLSDYVIYNEKSLCNLLKML